MKGLGNVRERVWSCSLRFLSEAKGAVRFRRVPLFLWATPLMEHEGDGKRQKQTDLG